MRTPPATGPARHRAARLRRPDDLVERTRWLFGACALVSLALTALGAVAAAGSWQLTALAGSSAALIASWLHRYLTGRSSVAADLLDALAIGLFALASPVPAVALGVTFSALWFRAVYGRRWEIWFYAATQCAGLVGALALWQTVPGHDVAAPAAPLLGALPIAPLLALVAGHLATVLLDREQAQAWDAALARLGRQLLGVTDVAQIKQRGWEALDEVCRVTPGLRAILVADEGDSLRVVGRAGAFPHAPTTLRRTPLVAGLTAAAAGGEPTRCAAPPELVRAAGSGGSWTALQLPDVPEQYMLVDRVAAVGDESLVVVRSVLNQVALAIRATSAHRELEVQARTDALTGLANRSTFSAALEAAGPMAAGRPWALFVDLDDFKVVNDRLGHAAGDELLRTVGARLAGTVRHPGLCARLGGDEFAVLVHAADDDEARALAQRLVDVVSAPVRLSDGTAQVGASVGVARVVPGTPWTETLQRADLAMYAAKAAGKNRVRLAAGTGPVAVGPRSDADADTDTDADTDAAVVA
jgi:diguanylate cyclase (GGDEF)-like protein